VNRFLTLALILWLTPATLLAQSANERLTQGIVAYNELEWETAIQHLNEALRMGLPEASQIEAYRYLGFCYIEINRPDDAKRAFENILKLNAAYELDRNLPPKYLDVFREVKSTFRPPEPEKKTGEISVQSEPPARVTLDNVLQNGMTPMTIRDVMAGTHSLKLTRSGYQDWLQQVQVEAGKTADVNVKLLEVLPPRGGETRPEQPLPAVKKGGSALPWILLGGLAAAGGAAAAFVVLSGGDDGGNGDDNGSDDNGTPGTTSLGISLRFP
jgi:tetratricopeptide (TPR) repeat protein